MLTLIIIVAVIVLIISFIVAATRRHDKANYFDQDRDPFYAESARLAAAGLLYEQQEKGEGRPRGSYIVTPAGEAALRVWLREPMNDPGMLKLYFAGIVAPTDVLELARSRRDAHEERVRQYERLEQLLPDADDWRFARDTLDLGRRFEQACVGFWNTQVEQPIGDVIADTDPADL